MILILLTITNFLLLTALLISARLIKPKDRKIAQLEQKISEMEEVCWRQSLEDAASVNHLRTDLNKIKNQGKT